MAREERRKPRYGLMELKVGARVLVPNGRGGGKGRDLVTVADKERHPDAKFVVRCLDCGKQWPEAKAMVAEHPPHAKMAEAEEIHRWAYYSDDMTGPLAEVPKGATKEQAAEIEAANKLIRKIGLASTERCDPPAEA